MKINSITGTSFKSCIPVMIHTKEPNGGQYHMLNSRLDYEIFGKCQNKIVRNLNKSIKNPNEEFIDTYAAQDREYRNYNPIPPAPKVTSIIDNQDSKLYLITGRDIDNITQMRNELGYAKSEIMARIGASHSFEERMATNAYYKRVHEYLKNCSTKITNGFREPLVFNVFFDEKRNKKGEIKDYIISKATFTTAQQ